MHEGKSTSSSMAFAHSLSMFDGDTFSGPTLYQSVVFALHILIAWLNLSFVVNKVSQFMQRLIVPHGTIVKHILHYLKHTSHFGLLIQICIPILTCFLWCWLGYMFFLGPDLISWSSMKQPIITRSNTKAEYKAFVNATAKLIWYDNIGAIYLSINPIFYACIKHVAIDYHFVREKVARGDLMVKFIFGHDQLVDLLTKSLVCAMFCFYPTSMSLMLCWVWGAY